MMHFGNRDMESKETNTHKHHGAHKTMKVVFDDFFMSLFQDFPGPFMSISISFQDSLILWILNKSDFLIHLLNRLHSWRCPC